MDGGGAGPPGRAGLVRRALASRAAGATMGFAAARVDGPPLDRARVAHAQASAAGGALLATIGDGAVPPSLRAAPAIDLDAAPVAVPGGWFVPVLGDGAGFAVLDEADGAPLATAIADLGGLAVLGPPVTRPFRTADGWTAQAMARAVVGWTAQGNVAAILSAPDLLRQALLDDLLGASGVPAGAPPPRGATDAWHRLSWITDRAIRTAFLAPARRLAAPGGPGENGADGDVPGPDLAAIVGPPTSLLVTTGAWRRQRFERGIVEVPASADGTPELVALGLLLRRAASLPIGATQPDTVVGGTVVVRGPTPSVSWRASGASDWHVAAPATGDAPVRAGGQDGDRAGTTATDGDGGDRGAAPGRDGASASPLPTPSRTGQGAAAATRAPSATPAPARANGATIRVRTVVATGGTEQVVLANDGSASQDLGGWAVRTGTATTRYQMPAGLRLEPGRTVILLSGRDAPSSPPGGTFTLARRSLWKDDGGTVLLLDRDGVEVDRRSYP